MDLKLYLEKLGLVGYKNVYRNLSVSRLIEEAIKRGEGKITASGALDINTGKYTGRSPYDRFIVDQGSIHNDINWGKTNIPMKEDVFEGIYLRLLAYLQNKDIYIFDGYSGADKEYSMPVRFINEYASQNLFVHQLFIRPSEEELKTFEPSFTVICAPGFKAHPEIDKTNSEAFVIINLEKKMIIIGGTLYSGEMKKSVFSVMNYLLPKKGVLPMHCSANIGEKGDVALFFGLSGTGKTTLSADPNRRLIGDDEHGWSDNGIFNFEGGCYAKCINLSKENEPQIWNAIRFGTLLENVVFDENGYEDYSDASLTENTRAAYPIDFIPNAVLEGVGGHPNTILFLTADAFGVLPPISKLTKEQAMYHFMSGYTSKLAGTERGIKEPQATFSACFGEPFMPMNPEHYAKMLGEKIDKYNVNVYLVNTGWSGGPYGVGKRMKLSYTRAMVTAAINGELEKVDYEEHPIFKVLVPKSCPNVPTEILNPENTWENKDEYKKFALELAKKFNENFKKFNDVSEDIKNAGPNCI
jgi:phosphoenolpyruvate carboxykinase (ATP)